MAIGLRTDWIGIAYIAYMAIGLPACLAIGLPACLAIGLPAWCPIAFRPRPPGRAERKGQR
jgi:hypothetical protein